MADEQYYIPYSMKKTKRVGTCTQEDWDAEVAGEPEPTCDKAAMYECSCPDCERLYCAEHASHHYCPCSLCI